MLHCKNDFKIEKFQRKWIELNLIPNVLNWIPHSQDALVSSPLSFVHREMERWATIDNPPQRFYLSIGWLSSVPGIARAQEHLSGETVTEKFVLSFVRARGEWKLCVWLLWLWKKNCVVVPGDSIFASHILTKRYFIFQVFFYTNFSQLYRQWGKIFPDLKSVWED